MGTLREMLGDRYFDLLEGAAEQVTNSMRYLESAFSGDTNATESLSAVVKAASNIKAQTETRLAHRQKASLKKEDIEAVADALCRIPQSVERLVQRTALLGNALAGTELSALAKGLKESAEATVGLVRLLRDYDNLLPTQKLHSQLQTQTQALENVVEQIRAATYQREQDPARLLIIKDLLDRALAIASACAETGDLLHRIVLKYA